MLSRARDERNDMKIILLILIFCNLLLADRDGGPYIGLGYGLSQYDDDNIYKEQKTSDSTAMTFYAGGYVNKYLSVELGYVNFNQGNNYKVISDTSLEESVSFSSFNVSTLAHYAFFNDILDFYAKLGVGNMSGTNADGFSMLYGTGMGVRFSEMFSMKIAYDRYIVDYNKGTSSHVMNLDFIYSAFEIQF